MDPRSTSYIIPTVITNSLIPYSAPGNCLGLHISHCQNLIKKSIYIYIYILQPRSPLIRALHGSL